MRATIISDKDHETALFHRLRALIESLLSEKSFESEHMSIGRDDLASCMGCFGCWVKKPGECVIDDLMTQVNRNCMNSDVVIYLSPVIFGHFSANIKTAIDRWLPNVLPFFHSRPDGSTIHPARYDANPLQIMVGYGEGLSEEDRQLFSDIMRKHRRNVEVLIYQGVDTDLTEALRAMKLARVGGQL